MRSPLTLLAALLTGGLTLFFCPRASALVVDWDTLSWPAGSGLNSFDIDSGNPGSDVTVNVGGGNTWTNDATSGTATPAILQILTGGLNEKSFEIAANLHTNSHVIFQLDFSGGYALGCGGVSFTIFDIDLTTNNDKITNIYGIGADGITQVAATITNLGPGVSVSGTGLSQVITGNVASADNTSNGNATITFDQPIIGFAFTFANNAGAPRYQDIALSDITFIPIPELNANVLAASVCVVAATVERMRRQRLRRRRAAVIS